MRTGMLFSKRYTQCVRYDINACGQSSIGVRYHGAVLLYQVKYQVVNDK